MATCKECLHHGVCEDRDNLMLTVNNIFELMYQHGVEHSCVHFKSTADVVPKSEVERWIFENSPFEMLDIAFKRLFPNVKYTAFFEPNIRDGENGEKVCGLTDFDDDGKITIFIDTDLSINDATEIFAHELAHAGVGVQHEHDEVWEKAFDDLFNEYNRIGEEMFGSNIDAPKGESYSNALSEIDKIKCNFARKIFEELGREVYSKIPDKILPVTFEEMSRPLDYNDGLNFGSRNAYFDTLKIIAELKKKYTEGANENKNL